MSPLLVIAAGGTGGHMFPAQALAEAMLARGWRVKLSTDARGARYAGGFPAAVTVEQVASATPARGGAAAKAAVPFRICAGVMAARRAMRARSAQRGGGVRRLSVDPGAGGGLDAAAAAADPRGRTACWAG